MGVATFVKLIDTSLNDCLKTKMEKEKKTKKINKTYKHTRH
jgi:hypothetical protein